MTIEQRLKDVFDDVLETGDDIDPAKKREKYDNWDSLANVTLLMAINTEFGDVLGIEDIAELDSFEKILNFMSTKI
jgi:acyl carrier protein